MRESWPRPKTRKLQGERERRTEDVEGVMAEAHMSSTIPPNSTNWWLGGNIG